MREYNSTAKERRLTMPKKVVLEFPVEFPKEDLKDGEVAKKGKEVMVLELFKRGKISSGYAADLLGLCLADFIELLKQKEIPFCPLYKRRSQKRFRSYNELQKKEIRHVYCF
jgi:predicted HTH domain antitoxin